MSSPPVDLGSQTPSTQMDVSENNPSSLPPTAGTATVTGAATATGSGTAAGGAPTEDAPESATGVGKKRSKKCWSEVWNHFDKKNGGPTEDAPESATVLVT